MKFWIVFAWKVSSLLPNPFLHFQFRYLDTAFELLCSYLHDTKIWKLEKLREKKSK